MIAITGEEQPDEILKLRRTGSARSIGHLLLTKRALGRMLARCEAGELQSAELVEIANQLEARDEVDYERGAERVIADTLFELASPEINGELTPTRCRDLIRRLS